MKPPTLKTITRENGRVQVIATDERGTTIWQEWFESEAEAHQALVKEETIARLTKALRAMWN
jgi:hypothetical protein